jgi:mono/diheme cytochrome c family protein
MNWRPACAIVANGPFTEVDAMMPGVRFVVRGVIFLAALICVSDLRAQDEAEDSPYRPGLVAKYTAGSTTAARTDEVIAFDWQAASCDARLPVGDFSAAWRGRLWARGAGQYHLHAFVQGQVTVKLADKTVLTGQSDEPKWLESQPLDLEFDHHPLEVTYQRGAKRGQLALFWSGPDFRLEPVPAWALVHDKADAPSTAFERGRQLASALRCAACHKDSATSIAPAPALDRLSGNINEAWLVDWLASSAEGKSDTAPRRMPHLNLTRDEATAIAAWLLREAPVKAEPKKDEQKETKVTKEESKGTKAKKGKGEEKPKPSAEEGEKLLLTRGCLACHQLGNFGLSGLFGGGDLSSFVSKRPADFLTRWLADPAAINRDHRMPVFSFTADEMTSLNLWAKKISSQETVARARRSKAELLFEGQKLVASLKCAVCHTLSRENPFTPPAADQKELTAASDWNRSCLGQSHRDKNQPGYQLVAGDVDALKTYYSTAKLGATRLSAQARGRDLLGELNCLACHQREGADRTAVAALAGSGGPALAETSLSHPTHLPALQDKLVAVAEAHGNLAPLIPAMTPPALNSVGDKLLDKALEESIVRKGRPHRPYLLVQMPKFILTKEQLAALTAYFTATDRIPSGGGFQPAIQGTAGQRPAPQALAAAGPRLVTTDGLACTSCHQVGSVLPTKAPLNARGPDMSMLGNRIRREWFDRWCNNPARIVPRMEMPAVKIPVRGVLNDNVEDQLAAVWHILNTPGFQPPEPDPVRVLRLSGLSEKNERPLVIHDVFKDGDKTYLFPLVIGLPNRHNILFDLETNRLAAWWLGDTARQRTKGKSWYWEMGGKSIQLGEPEKIGPMLIVDGKKIQPEMTGQFAAVMDIWGSGANPNMAYFDSRVRYPLQKKDGSKVIAAIQEIISKLDRNLGSGETGFQRQINITLLPDASQIQFEVVNSAIAKSAKWDSATNTLRFPDNLTSIEIDRRSSSTWQGDGTVILNTATFGSENASAHLRLYYRTSLPTDQYIAVAQPDIRVSESPLQVAPGFSATRLPLPADIMPSGFAWKADGTLIFCSLKGLVHSAKDTNGDGVEDRQEILIDGLATPYGAAVSPKRDNVIRLATKTGLTSLIASRYDSSPGIANDVSPWGRTDDYHDWAVGPIPGENGEFYVALPCQQDQRTEAAARYRGKILKLVPREQHSLEEPQHFDIEIVSAGHRFPMGMARNRDGELFVTDNQGNYNPFNELNHVKKGAHFGFINALEKEKGFTPPPLTEPAINIPHPWTRSVNGICFLETPVGWDQRAVRAQAHQSKTDGSGGPAAAETALSHPTKSIFGPLEGHLVGCEYDTRRLIRMSLDKVNGEYQGCCYPLSIPPADVEKGLLGPIVCAVKPTTGELYVGEIRDSGWGASNNIGQITKIKIEPEKLPCGIAEVKATKTGFTIDFFQSVDKAKAADVSSYSIESYRRESTPAYGGSDIDRRPEKITAVKLSDDAKRIVLTLQDLRPRHVYEFRLKNLAGDGGVFHPDEAHYTLRSIPQ